MMPNFEKIRDTIINDKYRIRRTNNGYTVERKRDVSFYGVIDLFSLPYGPISHDGYETGLEYANYFESEEAAEDLMIKAAGREASRIYCAKLDKWNSKTYE